MRRNGKVLEIRPLYTCTLSEGISVHFKHLERFKIIKIDATALSISSQEYST